MGVPFADILIVATFVVAYYDIHRIGPRSGHAYQIKPLMNNHLPKCKRVPGLIA
jgi:hypothetical protein